MGCLDLGFQGFGLADKAAQTRCCLDEVCICIHTVHSWSFRSTGSSEVLSKDHLEFKTYPLYKIAQEYVQTVELRRFALFTGFKFRKTEISEGAPAKYNWLAYQREC